MKKALVFLLTFVMVFSMAVPAFAADAEKDYNGNPIIVVRGISYAGHTYADGSRAVQVDMQKIFSVLLESVLNKFALKNDDALYDAVAEIVYDMLSPISYDKDGNSVYDVSVRQYPKSMKNYPGFPYEIESELGILKSAVERYGAENVYYFAYDWRKSPEEIAGELDALIETAKADSGKEKVEIICASMGCMVTTAYFYYYGYGNINTAIYLSGAHNGTYVCGDPLNGNINFDTDVIKNMISFLVDDNIFVRLLMKVFDIIGAFDYLTDFLNRWTDEHFDRAKDDVLRDCLGTMPGIWALCPDELFDSGVERTFGGCEEEYAGVLADIEETGRFVKSTQKVLDGAYEAGVKLTFVSNYNLPSLPIYDNAVFNSDSTIETVLSSNFATVANYRETLSDEYLATADSRYISPDKVIDASTAFYRDYTWFVKDADHVSADYGTEYSDFVFWLLESESQPTIYSNPEYPQFLLSDESLNIDILK